MLQGLDGGTTTRRSLAEVLGEYLDHRRRSSALADPPGCEMALEIVASFFVEENADLIAGASRWIGPDGSWLPGAPPASLLGRGLGICFELLPYSCCLSAPLIELLPEEVGRLGRWLAAEKVLGNWDLAGLGRVLVEQAPVYRRFAALQHCLEKAAAPWLASLGPGVEGRFQVARVTPPQVVVQVPDAGQRYTLRLPPDAVRHFHQGDRVAMVFAQRTLGWTALASSLPVESTWLDGRLEHLQRHAAGRPALAVAPRRDPN
ncbi:MAG TPA: hypothetical protein ENK10_09080 [Acidobacteria bacterium]|nr:hypothetical protein [Acidobacteriota bacterium]